MKPGYAAVADTSQRNFIRFGVMVKPMTSPGALFSHAPTKHRSKAMVRGGFGPVHRVKGDGAACGPSNLLRGLTSIRHATPGSATIRAFAYPAGFVLRGRRPRDGGRAAALPVLRVGRHRLFRACLHRGSFGDLPQLRRRRPAPDEPRRGRAALERQAGPRRSSSDAEIVAEPDSPFISHSSAVGSGT